MAKKTRKAQEERTIKLQIPVSRRLADELAKHARAMEWTQGKLAAVLLEFATEDFGKMANLILRRLSEFQANKRTPGLLREENNSEVRLQVLVTPGVAKAINLAADALNHTPVRLAALLLDCSLADQKWFMEVLKTKVSKAMLKVMGWKPSKYQSAELGEEA